MTALHAPCKSNAHCHRARKQAIQYVRKQGVVGRDKAGHDVVGDVNDSLISSCPALCRASTSLRHFLLAD
jgi:hypothetical protein